MHDSKSEQASSDGAHKLQACKPVGNEEEEGEQAYGSNAALGTILVTLPGLPNGVKVTRNNDSFLIHAGTTINERDELMVWYSQHEHHPKHLLKSTARGCIGSKQYLTLGKRVAAIISLRVDLTFESLMLLWTT